MNIIQAKSSSRMRTDTCQVTSTRIYQWCVARGQFCCACYILYTVGPVNHLERSGIALPSFLRNVCNVLAFCHSICWSRVLSQSENCTHTVCRIFCVCSRIWISKYGWYYFVKELMLANTISFLVTQKEVRVACFPRLFAHFYVLIVFVLHNSMLYQHYHMHQQIHSYPKESHHFFERMFVTNSSELISNANELIHFLIELIADFSMN